MQFLLLLLLLNHLMFIVICIYMYAIPFVAFVTEPSNVYCHLYLYAIPFVAFVMNHLMFIVIYMYAILLLLLLLNHLMFIVIFIICTTCMQFLLLLLLLNHLMFIVICIYMYAIPFVAFVTEPSNVYCHLYPHVCNSFCCFCY